MRQAWTLLACSLVLLAGCSVKSIATQSPQTGPAPSPVPAAKAAVFHGRLHGGQQPISGASVYMYQISTAGFSLLSNPAVWNPSVSLLKGGAGTNTHQDLSGNWYVVTDQNGNFGITAADFTCGAGQQVYLYSIGGSPGPGNPVNLGAGLMAVLGDCGNFANLPSTIQMNEVSTVAAAYALAGYAADATHISGSNTAASATGMANAALAAWNLNDLATGQALATTPASNGGNGIVPQTEINTLADILAACINSTDVTYPNQNTGACGTLFSNASATTGVPTDTATAAINIAHNPGTNVGNLYGLATSTAPFQPILTTAPNDWTIGIEYTGGGLNAAEDVAIDGSGNVWVTDEFTAGGGNGQISEFTNLGKPLSGSNGFTGNGVDFPVGIAIDLAGNAWVANLGANVLSAFKPSGAPLTNSPFSGGGLANPTAVAIDAYGDVWAVNGNNSVSEFEFDTSGNVTAAFANFGGGVDGTNGIPTALAADGSGNVWVVNYDNSLSKFFGDGTPLSGANGFQGGNLDNPMSLAIDGSGYVWVANDPGSSLSEFQNNGTPVTTSAAFTGGGLQHPQALAIDGIGNVWVTTSTSGAIVSEFNSAGTPITPSTGYAVANSLAGGHGIAVDESGNVWISGSVGPPVGGGLVELVGAGIPILTPLSVAAEFNSVATVP